MFSLGPGFGALIQVQVKSAKPSWVGDLLV